MTSCFKVRSLLTAMVGNHVSEADRLRVEEHLAECESCRAEKARWLLLETLRDRTPQPLGGGSRQSILSTILTLPRASAAPRFSRRSTFWPGVMVALAMGVVILGVLFGRGEENPPIVADGKGTSRTERTSVEPFSPPPQDLVIAPEAGALDYGGARIRFSAGSRFRMHPQTRQVDLLAGELDVAVTPQLPGRFQVVTPAFSVEVLGTHFLVKLDRVETYHGKVRVRDSSGTELAMLTAGDIWKLEKTEVSSVLPTAAASTTASTRPRSLPSRAGVRSPLQRAPRTLSAERLLTEARSILGAGNPVLARTRIDAALDADPNRRERAMAELLAADTLLVESRYEAALAGYRRTMALFAGFPEAETAAFAIAQILSERGGQTEARAALSRYLERFPHGRFHEEAARKLAQISIP